MTRLLITKLLLVLALSACVSSQKMSFTVVAPEKLSGPYTLLKEGAVGSDCESGYGRYEVATQKAISSVEGANALVNVEFSRREMPIARICVTVTGDAIRL